MTAAVKRRYFITLLGGAAGWPHAARAQQGERMRRVGIFMPYPESDAEYHARVHAFRQELARLGWIDGANVRFDEHWTADDMTRVRAEAASLVASTVKLSPIYCTVWRMARIIDADCILGRQCPLPW
jgi:putative ABC transport system substrate-binding protein